MHIYGYSFYLHDVYNNQRYGKHHRVHENKISYDRTNFKKYEERTKNDTR